ncbi:hypothetical protein Pan216_44540 [Planctomycetes bacterium Pan216]|uniref:Uncharacterized protein n=1 Tax=Kolteria novifilia TaxID=2527975 RepID=A0A518B9I3_9BACT|nr:hypothetical protein Pan216_44540 [Planctomycetes bacterium Pan216]
MGVGTEVQKIRQATADLERAKLLINSFFDGEVNRLNSMAFAANTAGTSVLSLMTEKAEKTFFQVAAEQAFMLALTALPGGLAMSAYWKNLALKNQKKAERVLLGASMAGPGQSAGSAVAGVEKSSGAKRTTNLRTSLVKIGQRLQNGADLVLSRRVARLSDIIERYAKGESGLYQSAMAGLYREGRYFPIMTKRLATDALTMGFERELLKAFVSENVTVHMLRMVGFSAKATDVDGLNTKQLGYIKKRFKEINGAADLIRWGAKEKRVRTEVYIDEDI